MDPELRQRLVDEFVNRLAEAGVTVGQAKEVLGCVMTELGFSLVQQRRYGARSVEACEKNVATS